MKYDVQNFRNRRSAQKCAQNAGENVHIVLKNIYKQKQCKYII